MRDRHDGIREAAHVHGMSTKIYDGLRAVDRDPFVVARRIRDVLEPWYIERVKNTVAAALGAHETTYSEAFRFDLPPSFRERWDKPIPTFSWDVARDVVTIVDELFDSATHTFSDLDFGYQVVLLPNGLGDDSEPLVLLFCETGGRELRNALMDAGIVTDYGYWDNTDHPDEVTDEAWDERRRAWMGPLDIDTPAEAGLMIEPPRVSAHMAC